MDDAPLSAKQEATMAEAEKLFAFFPYRQLSPEEQAEALPVFEAVRDERLYRRTHETFEEWWEAMKLQSFVDAVRLSYFPNEKVSAPCR